MALVSFEQFYSGSLCSKVALQTMFLCLISLRLQMSSSLRSKIPQVKCFFHPFMVTQTLPKMGKHSLLVHRTTIPEVSPRNKSENRGVRGKACRAEREQLMSVL